MLVRACQHFLFGRLLFVGDDAWWGGPLLNAVLVTVPTLLIAWPLARTRMGRHLRYGLPLGLAGLGVILLVPRLATWAAALLALGIAVRAEGWLTARSAGFERLVTRSLPILLLVPALGGAALRARRAHPHAPSTAAAPGLPNILLLVLDTVRGMELGLYGSTPSFTPTLDALGTQGVVFEQAYSAAPWTAPSHASLFTGRRHHELSIDWRIGLDGTWPTLAERLTALGYASIGVVANTEYTSRESGIGRGFGDYEDYQLTIAEAFRWTGLARQAVTLLEMIRRPGLRDLTGRIGAPDINRRFLRWIDHRPAAPFFGFLNYYDAHAPYFPPEPYWSRFLPGEPRRPHAVTAGAWSIDRVLHGRRAYDGAIAYLDEQVGALLDSLRLRDALRETILVVVGDHGEEFLEHGIMGHGNSLYAPSVRVPFIMVWPGHLPRARVAAPVSLTSLPATLFDLLQKPGPFPGPGLAGSWTGLPPAAVAVVSAVTRGDPVPARYPVSHGSLGSARLGRYRYISGSRDTLGQLYDVEADPLESRDLAREPWAASILRALRDTVQTILPGGKRPTR